MMKPHIKEILQKRGSLDKRTHLEFSKAVCEKLEDLPEYKASEHILFFYPYQSEVDILPCIKKALSFGKKVYFPKVFDDTVMEFFCIENLDDFTEGYKGIKEPNPVPERKLYKSMLPEKCCVIAPGSAFDYEGNRAGYGKGYYDRFLEDVSSEVKVIGVCFSCQMLEKLPDVKSTDVPMDIVVNEKEIIEIDRLSR